MYCFILDILSQYFSATAAIWGRLVLSLSPPHPNKEIIWLSESIDFKVEKNGIIHASVAKVSFDAVKISENAQELMQTIIKLKPTAAKGTYVKSVYMSSTMGVGVEIDANSIV